jgi:outer membrane protein OmpA-like peptidoglycan-associated protein
MLACSWVVMVVLAAPPSKGAAAVASADGIGMDLRDVKVDETGAMTAKVLDADGTPLRGQLAVSGGPGGAEKLFSAFPKVDTRLPVGKYVAVASAPGHLSQGRPFKVGASGTAALELRLRAAPDAPRVGLARKRVRLTEPVAFEPGGPHVTEGSFPLLDEVVDLLLGNPGVKLRIEGRTGDAVSAERNASLGRARANDVMRYFIEHGVAAGRLSAFGSALEKNDDPAPGDDERMSPLVLQVVGEN